MVAKGIGWGDNRDGVAEKVLLEKNKVDMIRWVEESQEAQQLVPVKREEFADATAMIISRFEGGERTPVGEMTWCKISVLSG